MFPYLLVDLHYRVSDWRGLGSPCSSPLSIPPMDCPRRWKGHTPHRSVVSEYLLLTVFVLKWDEGGSEWHEDTRSEDPRGGGVDLQPPVSSVGTTTGGVSVGPLVCLSPVYPLSVVARPHTRTQSCGANTVTVWSSSLLPTSSSLPLLSFPLLLSDFKLLVLFFHLTVMVTKIGFH